MKLTVLLGSCRKFGIKYQIIFTVIFKSNNQEISLRKGGHVDQPFFPVFDLLLTLDGIIQCIAENGADIHHIHKIKQCAIHYTGHGNMIFHAEQIF